jgi:hypothetical protein
MTIGVFGSYAGMHNRQFSCRNFRRKGRLGGLSFLAGIPFFKLKIHEHFIQHS